jgi:Holliday junction resolvase RusA-like endonuclease
MQTTLKTSSIIDVLQRVIDSPDHVLEIQMPLFSKARPRLTRSGHAYMPAAYREAQLEMQCQIRRQWQQDPLEGPLALHVEMHGEGRGDADNLVGALLDAAGPSKGKPGMLWVDDRVSIIPYVFAEWHKAPKTDSRWTIKILVM